MTKMMKLSSSCRTLMTVAFTLMILGQSSGQLGDTLGGLAAGKGNLVNVELAGQDLISVGKSVLPRKQRAVAADRPWICIMQRFNGSLDFNRSWTEYENGFNDSWQNGWIGLRKIHEITNRPGEKCELLIQVQSFESQKWYSARYSNFSVGGAETNYTLHVGCFIGGDAGDSLSNSRVWAPLIQNGTQFSTTDKDHDTHNDYNCAKFCGAGWWFAACGYSCLTCSNQTGTFCWNSLITSANETNGRLSQASMCVKCTKTT